MKKKHIKVAKVLTLVPRGEGMTRDQVQKILGALVGGLIGQASDPEDIRRGLEAYLDEWTTVKRISLAMKAAAEA